MLKILFIICFVPVVLVLFSGLLFSPVLLFAAVESNGKSLLAIIVIALGFNGVLGVRALLELSVTPINERYPYSALRTKLIHALIAACSVWFLVDIDITVLLVLCPPIMMTLYLVFKQSGYLMAAHEKLKEDTKNSPPL